jgi:hypothetical protein
MQHKVTHDSSSLPFHFFKYKILTSILNRANLSVTKYSAMRRIITFYAQALAMQMLPKCLTSDSQEQDLNEMSFILHPLLSNEQE